MKKTLLILAAMVMSANCLVSCGDDKNEDESSHIVIDHPHDGTMLNPNDATTINSISDINGLKGHIVVTAKTSKVLLQKHIDCIGLFLLKTISNKAAIGSHIEVPSNEFSSECFRVRIYPNADVNVKNDGVDSMDLYLESDKIDGLDLAFRHKDGTMVKQVGFEDKALHLKLDKYAHVYAYLNGKFDVASTDTVDIEAKPQADGTLKCNVGIDMEDNEVVLYALQNLLGMYKLENTTIVDDVNASYQQEIITLKLISGSRTFNLKVYGKPFKIEN